MNKARKLIVAVGCISFLLMAGCYLGDPVAHRTVAVTLPVPQGGAALSVTGAQVQEALKLIDGVLAAHGYTRGRNPLAPEDQARGLVAFYGVCGVAVKGGALEIGFAEAHKPHLSAPVKKLIGELKDTLARRYGGGSVRIED